jgi:hypothetical protein
MAVEITDLDFIGFGIVEDDDEMVIYDVSEASGSTKKITRGNVTRKCVKLKPTTDPDTVSEGDAELGDVEIDDLTSTNSSIGFTDGSSLDFAVHSSVSPAPSDIAAGASETVTATLTGATTSHQLIWNLTGALPDGMTCQAWISAADTVSFKFYNSTGSPISGATYGARVSALGFS